MRRNALVAMVLSACVGAVSCGGEGAPAEEAASRPPSAAAPGAQADTTEPTLAPLMREVYSYRGTGRDPFLSLMQTGDVRPLLQDLRVTTVTYDTRNPRNSVAVLRDTVENKAYPVRVGAELGRMRVVEIRPGEVVVLVQEFGAERRVVIQQRRRRQGDR